MKTQWIFDMWRLTESMVLVCFTHGVAYDIPKSIRCDCFFFCNSFLIVLFFLSSLTLLTSRTKFSQNVQSLKVRHKQLIQCDGITYCNIMNAISNEMNIFCSHFAFADWFVSRLWCVSHIHTTITSFQRTGHILNWVCTTDTHTYTYTLTNNSIDKSIDLYSLRFVHSEIIFHFSLFYLLISNPCTVYYDSFYSHFDIVVCSLKDMLWKGGDRKKLSKLAMSLVIAFSLVWVLCQYATRRYNIPRIRMRIAFHETNSPWFSIASR